eukprot:1160641-Pelagomonas_calceolata.AAC.10
MSPYAAPCQALGAPQCHAHSVVENAQNAHVHDALMSLTSTMPHSVCPSAVHSASLRLTV